MKVIYVSGKYTDPRGPWYVQQNIWQAAEVARDVWALGGCCALCPHLNTYNFDGTLITYEKFIAGDLELVERCDAILMLPDWELSKGARQELEHATIHGKPVFYASHRGWKAQLEDWANYPQKEYA